MTTPKASRKSPPSAAKTCADGKSPAVPSGAAAPTSKVQKPPRKRRPRFVL